MVKILLIVAITILVLYMLFQAILWLLGFFLGEKKAIIDNIFLWPEEKDEKGKLK